MTGPVICTMHVKSVMYIYTPILPADQNYFFHRYLTSFENSPSCPTSLILREALEIDELTMDRKLANLLKFSMLCLTLRVVGGLTLDWEDSWTLDVAQDTRKWQNYTFFGRGKNKVALR